MKRFEFEVRGKLTWKFFSAHPFFAKVRIITSESTSTITPSNQELISSRAANRVFQFASPKSVKMDAVIKSAAKVSASSGVCLYLKLSKAPGAAGAADFAGLALVAGGGFLGGGAEGGADEFPEGTLGFAF